MRKLVENLKRISLPGSDSGILTGKRVSNFNLSLPGNVQKGKTPELSIKKLAKRFSEIDGENSVLLTEALSYMQQLNHCQVKVNVRMHLTSTVLEHIVPVMQSTYLKYARDSRSVPESNTRKCDLANCISLLSELAISFKHVFRHIYNLNDSKYYQMREDAYKCAIRILELLRWEQIMRALRYQKMTDINWLHCNQVYFAMACCEDTDRAITSVLDMESLYGKVGHYSPGANAVSLSDLYISIQIMGLLDLISYPHDFLYIADGYIQQVIASMQIRRINPLSSEDGIVYIYNDQTTPPDFNKREKEPDSGMEININCLLERLNSDYVALMNNKMIGTKNKQNFPPAFSKLNIADCLSLIEILKSKLIPSERKEDRKPVYGGKSIRIYAGFAACYKLLRDMDHIDKELVKEERHLLDAMAQHSAMIVNEASEQHSSQWSVINESDGGMLVNTADSQYTTAMDVGQIVAYYPENSEDSRPHIGCITRFTRSREGGIDVTIEKMADYVEYVAVNNPLSEASKTLLAGLLFNDDNGSWYLALQQHKGFVPGTPLKMKRNQNMFPVRIGRVSLSRREFSVFEIRGPNL